MKTFRSALVEEIKKSQDSNFGAENYDEYRFGKLVVSEQPDHSLFHSFKQMIKKVIGYDKVQKRRAQGRTIDGILNDLQKYEAGLENLYKNVDTESKDIVVKLIAFRFLGYSKIKLPSNNPQYWRSLEKVKTLRDGTETYDPHFMHFILEKYDLNKAGYDIKLFFSELGIAIDFLTEQYTYKVGDNIIVGVKQGDTVLDVGGCWADTALYFAHKVGESGKVYSFEFIPDNIKLHNINTSLNPSLKKRIELVPHPVSNTSGDAIYFKDFGPGSKIELQPFEGQTGSTTTISIDDFVTRNNIQAIDFIKMDIEGAEPFALQGAINTIKKFRPVLAVAIYHSVEDFINIPKWILDLNLNYELHIGHYTIHAEETICFAKPKGK